MSRIKSNSRMEVLWASYGTLSFHLSLRLSRAPKSIHAETQSGRIVAWSGLFSFWKKTLVTFTHVHNNFNIHAHIHHTHFRSYTYTHPGNLIVSYTNKKSWEIEESGSKIKSPMFAFFSHTQTHSGDVFCQYDQNSRLNIWILKSQ